MSTEEMLAAGLATEKRLVRFRRENKPMTELHEVWYSTQSREAAASHDWK